MLNPSKSRLQQVLKLSKAIFRTSYNPEQVRTGAKVLRQPLKGEVVREYYKPNMLSLKFLNKIDPDFDHWDEHEVRRLEKISARKKKGKGKPTKSKGQADPKQKKKKR